MRQQASEYRFGDVLAIARLSWVEQMAGELAARGVQEYRRSDAAVARLLRRGPVTISGVGAALGVSRQAARKVVDGLEARGYATTRADDADGRRTNVVLTPVGERWARTVEAAVTLLNRRLATQVSTAQLQAADAVLRAAIGDGALRRLADLVPPP